MSKYSAADLRRMRAQLANLLVLLDAAEAAGDWREAEKLRNQIRGLRNSISGRYN